MDDWAILLRHDNPAALVHDIKALLDRVHQVTQECGHTLNFSKGKTAVMLQLRGLSANVVAKQHVMKDKD
eukprot:9574060-Prorocentrum_lima.AAC.1